MAWDLASASVLKLVLNRLVRTRMPGGVGGAPGQPGPLSRSVVLCSTTERCQHWPVPGQSPTSLVYWGGLLWRCSSVPAQLSKQLDEFFRRAVGLVSRDPNGQTFGFICATGSSDS